MSDHRNQQKGHKAPKASTSKTVKRSKETRIPISIGLKTVSAAPQFKQRNSDSVTVSHREFFHSVSTILGANFDTHTINPGLVDTFPWLSALAMSYESYRFLNLSFEYIPRCATTTAGSLMMAVDFDVSDPILTDYRQLYNFAGCVDTPLWNKSTLNVPVGQMRKLDQRFNRTGAALTNVDLKLYDLGTLYITTLGSVASAFIGDVFVRYTVELITPQNGPDLAGSLTAVGTGATPFPVSTIVGPVKGLQPFILSNDPVSGSLLTFTTAWEGLLETAASFTGASAVQMVGTILESPDEPAGTSLIRALNYTNTTSAPYSQMASFAVEAAKGAIVKLSSYTLPSTAAYLRWVSGQGSFWNW